MGKPLSRRDFLKLSAAAVGSALVLSALKNVMGDTVVHGAAEIQTAAEEKIVASTCHLCSAGCGVLVRVADGRVENWKAIPCTRSTPVRSVPKDKPPPSCFTTPTG
ncbi:MAG: twin-arginine translocation signal domain-containing protein [Chloroflexi bacterium]|nr:twin-arginine translocation signal domain-containing protein [Chloroflexota bacterium]